MKKIFEESKSSIAYSRINLNIKSNQRYNLLKHNIKEIKGMLK